MVLHVFISFLGGVPLSIPYGLYSGTSLGGTTRGILGGFPGRVLSDIKIGKHWNIHLHCFHCLIHCFLKFSFCSFVNVEKNHLLFSACCGDFASVLRYSLFISNSAVIIMS